MKKVALRLFVVSMMCWASGCQNQNGIDGNNNSGNNVVMGDNNVIQLDQKEKAGDETISLAVLVDNTLLNSSVIGVEQAKDAIVEVLTYDTESKDDGTLIIRPHLPYLDNLRRGNSVGPKSGVLNVFEAPFFLGQYPNLDIRLVNNSDETIFFQKAVIEVVRSFTDTEPLLYLEEFANLSLIFLNDGWGDIQNATVKFNLFSPSEAPQQNASYRFQENLSFNSEGRYNLDLKRQIGELAGVKMVGLDAAQLSKVCNNLNQNGFGYVTAVGKVDYSFWDALSNQNVQRTLPFTSTINMFNELGADESSSFQYETMLRTSGENYKVDVNLSQSLKPTEVDRFNILLGSEKSSYHLFKIKLFFNNNKFIETEPIDLHILMPRSYQPYLKELMNKGQKGPNKVRTQGGKDFKVWVNKLNIRSSPDVNGPVVTQAAQGETLFFTGKKSSKKATISLQGNKYTDFFYSVKTMSGKEGWAFGAALRK